MKNFAYGLICILICVLIFVSGYYSHKPLPKIVIQEIIPKDKQCYDDPLDFNAICKNYLELIIQQIQAKWELKLQEIQTKEDTRKEEEKIAKEKEIQEKEIYQKNIELQSKRYQIWQDGYLEGFRKAREK